MPPEAWTAIGVIVSAISAAVSAVLVAVVTRTNAKVEAAKTAAESARDNTVPVANGFARNTTDALKAIRDQQGEHGAMLGWLKDALIRHLDEHAGPGQYRQQHWPDPPA